MIALRIEVEEKELLRRICRARGEDLSSFVRRAIRMELARLSYLSEEEKKALGWNQIPNEALGRVESLDRELEVKRGEI
jgi:hypothetical protein